MRGMKMSKFEKPKRKRNKPKAIENLKPMQPGGKQSRGAKKMGTMLNTGRTAKGRGLPY